MDRKPPDIVLIITDQQRYDTIAALGASHMTTPHIDRLVESGVSFSDCHTTAPSCVPCRASLFSGYYPHTTGVYANSQPWNRTWVGNLRDAGYRTVNVGKMHTVPFDAPAGFDERYVVENKDRFNQGRWYFDEWDKALALSGFDKPRRETYRLRDDYDTSLGAFPWALPEDLHADAFVGRMAAWWLRTKPADQPVFLQVGFPGPHPPYDPPQDMLDRYLSRSDLPVPAADASEIAALPPPFAGKLRHDARVDHDSVLWSESPGDGQLRRLRAAYYANVELIDREVGRILDALEQRNGLDNTIVVFTSDHGDCLGDHGLIQKHAPYDVVTRVPMIVSAPGRFPCARVVDDLVQLFDIGPTILEWAGIEPPDDFEAISLNPSLNGASLAGREHVFCEQGGMRAMTETPGVDMLTMVRSRTHKLVHFPGEDYGQLFDLVQDPAEIRNLWDDPAAIGIRRQLLDVLREWLVVSNYTCRTSRAAAHE